MEFTFFWAAYPVFRYIFSDVRCQWSDVRKNPSIRLTSNIWHLTSEKDAAPPRAAPRFIPAHFPIFEDYSLNWLFQRIQVKETLPIVDITISHKSMLKMLLYFDIFDYPLNKKELSLAVDPNHNIDDSLKELIDVGLVDHIDEWYFIKGKKYQKRIERESQSPYFYKKAKRYAAIINRFPFVRGVYISGSLSKEWSDHTTDVDFFIITAPQRLWICRTMLILFKKIFLLNSRKYFCLNYFIDTDSLEIEEKNIFTATEVSFLKPIVNRSLFEEFKKNNGWTTGYYPREFAFDDHHLIEAKDGFLKKTWEKLLKGGLGERLDIWSMKKTLKHWRSKFPDMGHKDFDLNFKSSRKISKHHPSGFQKKVVESLALRIKDFETEYQIPLK